MSAELHAWYRANARDLPWRRTRDPYAVLVSEVMLQQTQVARVIPRYEAWLERWPTAEALAAAPLAQVLAEWVGLGYNRRAKALWEAARVIADRGWPEDLRELPGVGEYTAAAVGAFALGRNVLPVDTNVRRVLERSRMEFEASPEAGQALMELGATLCRAREARCGECPLGPCASRGLPVKRPVRRPAQRFEDTDRFARGRVLAALAGREPWPASLDAQRLERAVNALVSDGMAIRDASGVRLP